MKVFSQGIARHHHQRRFQRTRRYRDNPCEFIVARCPNKFTSYNLAFFVLYYSFKSVMLRDSSLNSNYVV